MLAYSLFVASVGFQATASGWALAPGVCPARISSLAPFPRLDATADGEEELSQNLSLFDSDFFAPRFSTEVVASGQKLLFILKSSEVTGSGWSRIRTAAGMGRECAHLRTFQFSIWRQRVFRRMGG